MRGQTENRIATDRDLVNSIPECQILHSLRVCVNAHMALAVEQSMEKEPLLVRGAALCAVTMSSIASRPWTMAIGRDVSIRSSSRRRLHSGRHPPGGLRPIVHWLDLRGSGLSVLERLIVEEMLWKRQDSGSWVILGHHEPTDHRFLSMSRPSVNGNLNDFDRSSNSRNRNAVIVMGIGGKPHKLLDIGLVARDQVQVIRRFSGGGTVVLDSDSIWTTIIGRNDDSDCDKDNDTTNPPLLPRDQRYPRQIMEWSMSIFGPLVEGLNRRQQEAKDQHVSSSMDGRRKTMVLDTKSCAVENTGRVITIANSSRRDAPAARDGAGDMLLSLREHDYVLGGTRKVAGNAQSVGKSGWLHHTSWLWDASWENMGYLSLPDKRPAYRDDRSHADFLTTLQSSYPHLVKSDFYACMRHAVEAQFDLKPVTLPWVMKMVHEDHGDLNQLLQSSRTRVVRDLEQ
jgi:lipoate-protein ligase A